MAIVATRVALAVLGTAVFLGGAIDLGAEVRLAGSLGSALFAKFAKVDTSEVFGTILL